MFTKQIFADSGDSVFILRLNKEEGVGIVTTTKGDNYFILDSREYWYDIIQEKYPAELKCGCKNNLFNLFFNYYYKDDEPEIRQIDIITKCVNCGKEKVQFDIDIDYSPTAHLINVPLAFCKTPKLIYDYTEISSFWTKDDMYSFAEFLYSLGLKNHAWFWENNRRVYRIVELSDIRTIDKYMNFFFSFKLNYISNTTLIPLTIKVF